VGTLTRPAILGLTIALSCLAGAQRFGRFGYADHPDVPGIKVDEEGLSAKHTAADKVRFYQAGKTWKVVSLSPYGSVVMLSKAAWSPEKVRFDLWAPGVSLYFPTGMRLRVNSTAAPYLTWTEGSVTNGVPTPDAACLALSFRDKQPPLAFGFPGGSTSLQVTGRPGAWVITTKLDFKGWVRVGLPIGTQGLAANSAASLGKLARTVESQGDLWTKMPPVLRKVDIESDLGAVEGTWRFDRPGAVLPRGAQFAQLGGYPIKVMSEVARTEITTEDGPVDIVKTADLTIRMPIRRIPAGRALAVGSSLTQAIGTVAPQDLHGIVELALESLTAGRDALTRKAAQDTLAEYLGQATYIPEPLSGQQLPFDADGNDLDLAAAHALLMQAISTTAKPASEANSLLTSVSWVQDAANWLPAVKDRDKARRAAALAAIAGALCPEPERRLTAAMFQAGMASERGFNVWLRRKGLPTPASSFLEPMPGLRRGLFSLSWPTAEDSGFASYLLSPIRVFSDGPATLTKDSLLQWPVAEPKPSVLTLSGSYPLSAEPTKNLLKFETSSLLGMLEVRFTPELAGLCEAKLLWPAWAAAPPAAVPVPRYSEPKVGPNPR
jgi:hypothetical protein